MSQSHNSHSVSMQLKAAHTSDVTIIKWRSVPTSWDVLNLPWSAPSPQGCRGFGCPLALEKNTWSKPAFVRSSHMCKPGFDIRLSLWYLWWKSLWWLEFSYMCKLWFDNSHRMINYMMKKFMMVPPWWFWWTSWARWLWRWYLADPVACFWRRELFFFCFSWPDNVKQVKKVYFNHSVVYPGLIVSVSKWP